MRHTRLAAGLDGLAQGDVPGIAKLIELGNTVSHDSGSAVPSQLHAVTVTAGYDIGPSTTRTPRARQLLLGHAAARQPPLTQLPPDSPERRQGYGARGREQDPPLRRR
jgi:hypothetical protein